MTAFKTFTEDEKAALKLHGLDTKGPSQLAEPAEPQTGGQ